MCYGVDFVMLVFLVICIVGVSMAGLVIKDVM